MRLTYVLPRPELGGGNKVIFQHVRLLRELGEEVTVLAEGPPPGWITVDAPYHDYSRGMPRLAEQDLVVATFWTTIEVALELDCGPVAHFCQGYEGDLAHLRPQLPEIEATYALPLPALTVSPHLGELLRRRFGRESRLAPPPLDLTFRPGPRIGPRRRPWVAVPGLFAGEVKGVPTALEALRALRRQGLEARVLRFATLPLGEEERRLFEPDLYLCGVPPEEVARALRRCDLLLFPSMAAEGFGLPLLEAMASGVPAVASRIPSTLAFASGIEPLVPPGDAEALAEAARELLENPSAWRRVRRAGLARARRFAPEVVAQVLHEAVTWAREKAVRIAREAPVLP